MTELVIGVWQRRSVCGWLCVPLWALLSTAARRMALAHIYVYGKPFSYSLTSEGKVVARIPGHATLLRILTKMRIKQLTICFSESGMSK